MSNNYLIEKLFIYCLNLAYNPHNFNSKIKIKKTKMKEFEIDFQNCTLSELEKIILDCPSEIDERIHFTANERRHRMNQDFTFDNNFIEHFSSVNDRLTNLMSELYDKMVSIKMIFYDLINKKQIMIDEFYLEGFIDYEDSETEDVEMPEWLINMKNSGNWSLLMLDHETVDTRLKEELLMSKYNWDIEIFDLPIIKEHNIWVCYMMHSLFDDGYHSLPDLIELVSI